MIVFLRVLFGIPAAAIGVWLWITPSRKVKGEWVAAAMVYMVAYLAIFHFWLKAF